jgi:hypothetical protein
MKKSIIFLVIIPLIQIFAQDFEPLPIYLNWYGLNNHTSPATISSNDFNTNQFIIGWQWGASARVADLYNSNMIQGSWCFDPHTLNANHTKYVPPEYKRTPYKKENSFINIDIEV